MTLVLSEVADYTTEEISNAAKFSGAIQHYLNILTNQSLSPADELRSQRNSAWLKSALATFHKKSSAEEICAYWSHTADSIIKKAWSLSGCTEEALALFALGKLGSNELNLSSDIDIVIVSKNAHSVENLKSVRKFISLLSDVTAFGFCFRVDTDLKPGGRLSPLICSVKQFEDYYWSSGETWERLALVRMRPLCGKPDITIDIQSAADKFVFRKFIDYSLLEDLKRLRSKIHSHYAQVDLEKINLKLAPGGIRDIELFIHSLQVIHGGKDPALRTTSTSQAATALSFKNRFEKNDLNFLIQTYWQFRNLENLVQIIGDNQTHDWHKKMGVAEFDNFKILAKRVESIVEPILGKPTAIETMPSDVEQRAIWLKNLNYSEISIAQKIPELMSLTALSTRTFYDEELRLRVMRKFIETISRVALDKDLGIALLIDFFKATRAKTAFFSLLAHEDRLIAELSILFGCSPYLGGILSARPELLDSYLYRTQATASDNMEYLLEELTERRLINEIISAIQFLQNKNVFSLCDSLSLSADEICLSLLQQLKNDFGHSDIQILALGKWGGYELGFRSDLDFIFVTKNDPNEIDQKIARRFIARLTEQHKGGSIYEVDMRLRPSGKGGPLLVSHQSLLKYLREKADIWERQSYLRARLVGDDQKVIREIRSAAQFKKMNSDDLIQLSEIRNHLIKTSGEKIEIKYSKGGLVDIEFCTQISILNLQLATPADTLGMIDVLAKNDERWGKRRNDLVKNYQFLRQVEQLFQLLNQHPVSAFHPEDEAFSRLAEVLSAATQDLSNHLKQLLSINSEILFDLDLRDRQK